MLPRRVDKHGKVSVDGPELRVRHDGEDIIGGAGELCLVTLDSAGAEVELPTPILQSITFAIGTLSRGGISGNNGLAQVDVEWDGYTTRTEAVCVLAEPIPERPDVDLVYVLNMGLRRTVVCDARTGERLDVFGVKVRLVAGESAVAWVDMTPPDAPLDEPGKVPT
jgi:hypothetical protein